MEHTALMSRRALSPLTPYLVLDEREPLVGGGVADVTTVFLTAATCPIGCTMCDLHRFTLPSSTPPGAIPRQIDTALTGRARRGWIKLYNSGNFFDPGSVPPQDYEEIARRCHGFSRVIVENHPRFGTRRLRQFRELIGVDLEVAVGLETVQPRWLARVGKRMSRDQFDAYGKELRGAGVDLRVFLIVGVPGIDVSESIRWARLSVRHAVTLGARHVSLIPARAGAGWGDRREPLPDLKSDELLELQSLALRDANGRAVVTVDLWDIDDTARGVQLLRERNLTQRGD